jgi:Uncharacterized protein involved in exopolysaccharide biosynthesis
MDIVSTLKQVAESLFVRRKKWILLTVIGALAVFLPVAYLISREPPRFQTIATIFLESQAGTPLFAEFSPYRPLSVQLAILQSRALAQSVIEALPRASVQDLIANPYGHDYRVDIQNWFRRLRGETPVVDSPEVRALDELRAARVAFFPQGPSGSCRSAPRPRTPAWRWTSPIRTLRSCSPGPVPSTWMTQKVPGST